MTCALASCSAEFLLRPLRETESALNYWSQTYGFCRWVCHSRFEEEKYRAAVVIAEAERQFKKVNKSFYISPAWREMRIKILHKYGSVCMACGGTERLHVDHIKPASYYPKLMLDPNNLQVLCEDCNLGKSNKFEFDFRQKKEDPF